MRRATLIKLLREREQDADHDWISRLSDRKKRELEFHDRHRDEKSAAALPKDTYEVLYGNRRYYRTVKLSKDYVNDWIAANVQGKVFLDYACGNGDRAIEAASVGSILAIGLDISEMSIKNARAAAIDAGVADKCVFIQGDCEDTGLPEGCIDVVLCSGTLHHLDLSYAFPELRRILAAGGRILAVEALDYNPLIKLYRLMTPGMRTEWEKDHILSLKDVQFASRFFEVRSVRFWHAFSILAAFFGRDGTLFDVALTACNALDALVLRLPLVQRLSWQFTVELGKNGPA